MASAEALLPRAHVRLRRIDLRVAVGLLLMLVAIFGGASLIRTAQARIPVLVGAAAVQPGDVITASDIRVAGSLPLRSENVQNPVLIAVAACALAR